MKNEENNDRERMKMLLRASKASVSKKMKWLEETREFYLKTIPKSTLRLILKMREREKPSR